MLPSSLTSLLTPAEPAIFNNTLGSTPYQRLHEAIELNHKKGTVRTCISTTALRNTFHASLPQWFDLKDKARALGYRLGKPIIFERDAPCDEYVDIQVELSRIR